MSRDTGTGGGEAVSEEYDTSPSALHRRTEAELQRGVERFTEDGVSASGGPTEPESMCFCDGQAGSHFDRSLCACGKMHTYCNGCGHALDDCSVSASGGPISDERLAELAAQIPLWAPARDLYREVVRLRAVLTQQEARNGALQRLADVTGNYLLYAPREKGHAAAHNRLWDAYREYEAFCDALTGVRSDG